MGKSSSLKKKRSKNSSQSRTRKRNKVKSRRNKSKKLRRQRDGSVSYSDDSDSRSLVSVSSSSSEDDYKSRRSRSRNRKDVKSGKKRSRRRSSSTESIDDSTRLKKRRGSRRGDGYEKRTRTDKKKRSRRDVSVSSRSRRSRSCSTCPSASGSGSDEIGYERKRGRSERKEKQGRKSEKVKRGSKKSRDRSRSCSSGSRSNENSDHPIEERVMEESQPRWLKSVITVVKQETESSRELITDEPKEEVYDYDDYPSCRSNDSNDGCTWRELPQHPLAVPETKVPLDDKQGEVSNDRMESAEESGKDSKTMYDEVGKNDDFREKNKDSSAPGGFNGDDIEAILRQRALENLRKFRGGLQTSIKPPITQIDKSDGDVKTPSSINTDPIQNNSPKGDNARVVSASNARKQIREPPVRRDSTTLPKNDGKASHLNDDGKDSKTVESEVASTPAQMVPAGVSKVEVNTAANSVSNKSKLVALRTRREASATLTTQKQESGSLETSKPKLVTKSSVNEGDLESNQSLKTPEDKAAISSVPNRPVSVKSRIRRESIITSTTQKQESVRLEPSQSVSVTNNSVNVGGLGTAQTVKPPECGNNGGEGTNTHESAHNKPSSSSISTSGEIGSDKLEEEAKDGSQFQQKTMSVMRGGEMVQVSYQVYIPKRAPALARRQLQR
ncbi:hypothetical protein CCACVL1_08095 [Corchorus capsularis]|uniref:Uncharacterized protein n=1 Tax=Corchorus capsularis TaxID=210143 RepID=A0A1R3J2D1_COCAP|nr:hypothetical protein CCACVL1_08095 [Corchorus capsularis]